MQILLLNNCTFLRTTVLMSIHILDLPNCNWRKLSPLSVMLHMSICLGDFWAFSYKFWGTNQWEGKKNSGKFDMQMILLKNVFVHNHTVCAEVITHVKEHPVGNSGSKVIYLELGFGFLQKVSNQMCSAMYGPLYESIPGLNEGSGGGNGSWHLCLARVCSDGRMKLHKQQSYSRQNWSNCSGPLLISN